MAMLMLSFESLGASVHLNVWREAFEMSQRSSEDFSASPAYLLGPVRLIRLHFWFQMGDFPLQKADDCGGSCCDATRKLPVYKIRLQHQSSGLWFWFIVRHCHIEEERLRVKVPYLQEQ